MTDNRVFITGIPGVLRRLFIVLPLCLVLLGTTGDPACSSGPTGRDIMVLVDQANVQGFWTIQKMQMENHRENHATIMTVSDVAYDTRVKDRFFCVNTISRGHLR